MPNTWLLKAVQLLLDTGQVKTLTVAGLPRNLKPSTSLAHGAIVVSTKML
jgi:hypothetical protein